MTDNIHPKCFTFSNSKQPLKKYIMSKRLSKYVIFSIFIRRDNLNALNLGIVIDRKFNFIGYIAYLSVSVYSSDFVLKNIFPDYCKR